MQEVSIDFIRRILYGPVLECLKSEGINDRKIRDFFAKCCKKYGDYQTLEAALIVVKRKPGDPISFLASLLGHKDDGEIDRRRYLEAIAFKIKKGMGAEYEADYYAKDVEECRRLGLI